MKKVFKFLKSKINVVYDYDLILQEESKMGIGETKEWISPLTNEKYKIYGKNR